MKPVTKIKIIITYKVRMSTDKDKNVEVEQFKYLQLQN